MSRLPKVIENLILDYYWSHRTFMTVIELNRSIVMRRLQNEIRLFWELIPQFEVTIDGQPITPFALL